MSDSESSSSDVFNGFALAVFEVMSALNASGDALTKPVGQSSARWRVLGRLSQGPQTVSEIARRIGNARQSVQRLADDLVGQELAQFVVNPGDRRAQLLQLTDQGWLALGSIEAEQERWTTRLSSVLDLGLLEQLASGLHSVAGQITEDFDRNYRFDDEP